MGHAIHSTATMGYATGWKVVPFAMLQAKPFCRVEFSSVAADMTYSRYTCNAKVDDITSTPPAAVPAVSLSSNPDVWNDFVLAPAFTQVTNINAVYGDPTRPDHFLFSTPNGLRSATWSSDLTVVERIAQKPYINPGYDPSGARPAGAFFQPGGVVVVATNREILYCLKPDQKNPLPTFTTAYDVQGSPPWPFGTDHIVSFAGGLAFASGKIRLYAVVVNKVISATDDPGGLRSGKSRLMWIDWDPATPFPQNWNQFALPAGLLIQHVATTGKSPQAYVAGGRSLPGQECQVYRITDDGTGMLSSFQIFMTTPLNDYIYPGWGGASDNGTPAQLGTAVYKPDDGQESFVNFSMPTGLAVAADFVAPNKTHVMVTDTAFCHKTLDDNSGVVPPTWLQMYTSPQQLTNPTEKITTGGFYEGLLHVTVCSWLDAKRLSTGDLELRVSCNDIATMVRVGEQDGEAWSFRSEHWESPPGYPAKAVLPGDVYQTLSYVDTNGSTHEFAIRYFLDSEVNTPYSSLDAIDPAKVDLWTGALHKLNVQPQFSIWRNIKANFGARGVLDANPIPDLGEMPSGAISASRPGLRRGGLPVWMAIDETIERLYVAVAHSIHGGVWYCEDPIPKIDYFSHWTRIPNTGPHPFNIRVINTEKKKLLLVSQAGNISYDGANYFDYQTSGVFLYERKVDAFVGEHWIEANLDANDNLIQTRNADSLKSWTQDVVLDPADPEGRGWFACVWAAGVKRNGSALDESTPLGGLYRTYTAGENLDMPEAWSKVFPVDPEGSMSVTSCTKHPDPSLSKEIYICTRFHGLYYAENADKSQFTLDAHPVEGYPFRAPMRVFYTIPNANAPNFYRIWVTSNGNSLHSTTAFYAPPAGGSLTEDGDFVDIDLGGEMWARISGLDFGSPRARNEGTWSEVPNHAEVQIVVDQVMAELSPAYRRSGAVERLKEAIYQAVASKLRSLRYRT